MYLLLGTAVSKVSLSSLLTIDDELLSAWIRIPLISTVPLFCSVKLTVFVWLSRHICFLPPILIISMVMSMLHLISLLEVWLAKSWVSSTYPLPQFMTTAPRATAKAMSSTVAMSGETPLLPAGSMPIRGILTENMGWE